MSKYKYITKFLIWRYKHISNKNFVFILSILVGLLAGLASVILKNITFYIKSFVNLGITFQTQQLYFIIPFIGLLLVWLCFKYLLKSKPDHAIPSILFALSKKASIIPFKKIYHPLITAPLTVGFGGSVGLLGPAIGSGAAISSNLGQLLHLDRKTKTLLISCAAAGAIASIFKSPVAAIIFAVEVFSLDLTISSLLPLLLASISSVLTSYFFMGDELLFDFKLIEDFKLKDTIFFIILGIGTGVASNYFNKIYFLTTRLFQKINNPFLKLIFGGLFLGVLIYAIPPLYGEGFSFINNLLSDHHIAALGQTPFDGYIDNIWVVIGLLSGIIVFKAIAMSTTLAIGGVGGIIIPTMVMGSTLGNVIAKIINNSGLGVHVSESNFTLVGMAGLIAGVIHAPLTAIFLIAEITGGYTLFIPLMITVVVSFIITKNTSEHTIYTKKLAEKGDLLTHDKDESVLKLMSLDKVIEQNFIQLRPEMSLREMLYDGVAKSSRNLFPVIDENSKMSGVILLDNIRECMFNQELYDKTRVSDYMIQPPEYIYYESDDMKTVMKKFQNTSAWNLPVIKNNTYYGFISKSKLLTSYRRQLINYTK